MKALNISLTEEEYDFVKSQPKGYVHDLIVRSMGGWSETVAVHEKPLVKNISAKKTGDGLHTCKSCGSLLPYFKGKCKRGCK